MTLLERPRAVIINGDDSDDVRDGQWFGGILRRQFELTTRIIDCATTNIRGLRLQLKGIFRSGGTVPLLVVYHGHGGLSGWAPWAAQYYKRRMTYREIGRMARDYAGPLLFVNSTCFAAQMTEEFEKQKLSAERVGVIAACEGERMSIGQMLLCQVLDAWLQKIPYRPGHMGEVYLVPDRTKGKTRIAYFEAGYAHGLVGRLDHLLLRRWYAIRSLWKPLEHTTYFSKRWGAPLDALFIEHLRPKPKVVEVFTAELIRQLPNLEATLWRIMPPAPPR